MAHCERPPLAFLSTAFQRQVWALLGLLFLLPPLDISSRGVSFLQARASGRAIIPAFYQLLNMHGLNPLSLQEAEVLRHGEPLKREMAGGGKQTFKISLDSGQYFRVAIEQRGIILSVILTGGNLPVEMDSPMGGHGPIYVSAIADNSGDYKLEVRSDEKWANAGEYEIKIEELRAATMEDKNRIASEGAFAEARRFFKKATSESRQAAIKKYQESLSYWERFNDRHWKALTLYSLGVTYRRLGELETAENYFNKSLTVQLDARDWRLRASALNDIGLNYQDLREHQKSLDSLNEALKIFREHGDRRGQASAFNNIGLAYAKNGQMRLAIEFYQKALPLRRAENDKTGELNVLNNIGGFYDVLGEPQKALEHYSAALKVWQDQEKLGQLNNRDQLATGLNNVAVAYDKLGEWQLALENYERALQIFQETGNGQRAAATLNNIGELYDVLGDPKSSMEYYDKARKLLEQVKDPGIEADVLSHIGQLYLSEGKLTGALGYFEKALTLKQSPRALALAYTNIGVVRALQGDLHKALEAYEKALSLRIAAGDRRGEAVTLQKRGEAYALLGQPTEALVDFNRAISLWKVVADRRGEAETLYSIARLERGRNQLNEALQRSEEAINVIESLRIKVNSQRLRTSYFAAQQNYYELYIDLRMRLYDLDRSPRHLETALQASERARARTLIDILIDAQADTTRGVNPNLLVRERDVQQKLNAKAQVQMELLNSKYPDERAAAIAKEQATAIAKELDALIVQYDNLQAQIRVSSPKYAHLTQPQALSLQEIQQLLDEDTLLLEFSLGDERSHLWLVSNTSIIGSATLPGRSEIEGAARQLYKLLTALELRPNEAAADRKRRTNAASEEFPSQASKLSRMLLGQVAGQLGKKRLLIVADGVLQYLPFGALPVPEMAGLEITKVKEGKVAGTQTTRYLIEDHEIVSLPSASAFALIRSEIKGRMTAPMSVAVIADPVFDIDDERFKSLRKRQPRKKEDILESNGRGGSLPDDGMSRSGLNLPPLPSTLREAQNIKKIAPSGQTLIATAFEANRKTAVGLQDGRYRIVHFATHGILNDEHPELSGVVLSLIDSDGRPQDGILRLHDIYNLKLPVELVVLSACSTGLGSVVKGEGLIGLTRGFMYAGSPRVIASLWRVDDLSTATLMEKFYQHILKGGMSPAAALRQAQIEMIKSKRWGLPFNWAGFVLQGEWK